VSIFDDVAGREILDSRGNPGPSRGRGRRSNWFSGARDGASRSERGSTGLRTKRGWSCARRRQASQAKGGLMPSERHGEIQRRGSSDLDEADSTLRSTGPHADALDGTDNPEPVSAPTAVLASLSPRQAVAEEWACRCNARRRREKRSMPVAEMKVC